ncbi:MAG: PsbP-related protein [Spirochaetota bacterium]
MKLAQLIVQVVVLVIVIFGIASCNKEEKGRYYNKEYKFSIVLPSNWELQQKEMGSVVVALSPEISLQDSFRENVNITVEEVASNVTAQSYFQNTIKNMKGYSKDFKILDKEESTIANRKAIRFIYNFSIGGLQLKGIQYQILHNNYAYVITCMALPYTFGKYEGQFKKIAHSFRFEK